MIYTYLSLKFCVQLSWLKLWTQPKKMPTLHHCTYFNGDQRRGKTQKDRGKNPVTKKFINAKRSNCKWKEGGPQNKNNGQKGASPSFLCLCKLVTTVLISSLLIWINSEFHLLNEWMELMIGSFLCIRRNFFSSSSCYKNKAKSHFLFM